MSDIGEEKYAIPIVDQYFGSEGEISTIDLLDNDNASQLFGILSNAAPVICINSLQRIFLNVSHERLLQFKKGRRAIIFALERLLKIEKTFVQSAHILLALAGAENETWENNATGIWKRIFQPRTGLSPLPPWERHLLISEAISPSNRTELRLLGVRAIYSSLNQAEMDFYGEGPGGIFPERWQPQTWDEIWKSLRSALALLDQVLDDYDEKVKHEAIDTFLNIVRSLLRTPLKQEILDHLGVQVDILTNISLKKRLIDVLGQILEYEIESLTVDEVEIVQQWKEKLLGSSYQDRLHRWVGKLNWTDRETIYKDESNSIDLSAIIRELANEGHENPRLLHSELEWLTSSGIESQSLNFALSLGRLDKDMYWLSEIQTFLPSASGFIAKYILGRHLEHEGEWIDNLIDEWVNNNPVMAESVLLIIHELGGTSERVDWLIQLVTHGLLPLERLGILWMYGWLESISVNLCIKILEPLVNVNEPKYTVIALHLIHHWIKIHKGEHNANLAELVVPILERVPDDPVMHASGMGWYYWEHICRFYLKEYPMEIVKATVNMMQRDILPPYGPQDNRISILIQAVSMSPEKVWPVIGKALIDAGDLSIYVWPTRQFTYIDAFTTSELIEAVDHSVMLDWVEKNNPEAPRMLAQHIDVERTPLPHLARELIIKYGEDEKVKNQLHPLYRNMNWSGSFSERLENMLNVVKSWLEDDHISVRNWAQEIIQGLETKIRKEKLRDDEDDLRWR
jgi:hypothetical protein